MRKIYILFLFVSVAFVSCTKKCYHCDNGVGGQYHSEMDVCPGDPQYNAIDDGQVITDNTGVYTYQCEKKK